MQKNIYDLTPSFNVLDKAGSEATLASTKRNIFLSSGVIKYGVSKTNYVLLGIDIQVFCRASLEFMSIAASWG
jgi:hypothetical protein